MDSDTSSSKKLMRKTMIVLGAIFLTIVLGIAALIFMISWEGSTNDIEAAANKFTPSSDWTETNRSLRGPRIACLDGGTCPEASISWQTTQPIDRVKFTESPAAAGWSNIILSDTCNPELQNSPGTLQSCSVDAMSGPYKVYLSIDSGRLSTYTTNKTTVSLSLRLDRK